MRRLLPVLLLVAALAASGCGSDADTLPARLPEVSLKSFDGGAPLALADVRGPVVLNFWAAWCVECRKEMPVMQDFSTRHEGVVDVIGIDYQDVQVESARQMVRNSGVTYPLYADLEGTLNGLAPFPRLRGLPFLALVDAKGRVVHREFRIIDDVAELESLVSEHLVDLGAAR